MIANVRKRLADERGIALVMLAVFLPVLVLLTGLAIDTANWWVHKRHLQTQADAAALAGATEYRFPACEDAPIEETAVRYSGGRDPEHVGVEPDHNLMPDATPAVPEDIHTWIQEPNFWGDTGILDEDLKDEPGPCEALFVDVKMTEEDAPGFFARGWVPEIDAQARVALKQLTTADRLIPVGVEDVNPVRVKVWMYDEGPLVSYTDDKLLGAAELYRRDEPLLGTYIWDNALGNGSGLPILVNNLRADKIGLRIALSGNPNSVECGTPLVLCYGAGAPIPNSTKFYDRGIGRIRGYDVSGSGVRLGEVRLSKPAPDAPTPCGDNQARDNGYFSVTCEAIDVYADLQGLDTSIAVVKAFIATDKNAQKTIDLKWDGSRWSGTGLVVTKGAGPLPIRITWNQESGTLKDGSPCPGTAACKGDLTDVHAHFAGARPWSGPIKQVQVVDPATAMEIGNVQKCPAGALLCEKSFVIRVAVGGRLELRDREADPISLRVFGGGSRPHTLDCDPAIPPGQLVDEIVQGCAPMYTKNTGQPCLSKNLLWGSPQPWNCVVVDTGVATSQPPKGLNQRILCSFPYASNCPSEGKPKLCTNRNKWWDFPRGDPRVLAMFLVPFGSFDTDGMGTVPVLDFAHFYVTGWHGINGFENPCESENPSYEEFEPGTEGDQGLISGHFFAPTLPNVGDNTGSEECDVEAIGGCVAVLTK